ncbi:MAG: HNH endonuclease [Limisphaerales bacterium]
MFHGKCAYCESYITHIDFGHIEHFKPKCTPTYYELAVDWGNLLLACGRCNGAENKGTKFPLANKGGPLVNPVTEDPSKHLGFDFDPKLKLANVLGISKRGETTRKTLGLNRRELLQHRSRFVTKLWVIARHYNNDNEAREIIDSAICPQEEYSAFAIALKKSL